ncbi:MAG: Fe2+-dependent dioxygenase [Acaryochloris sp. RU_4_1]|nr:Fe2+-dependent dioxygenase [Acaryochloris sp. RU_4_1]NJN37469.1 Fe2+-dependent dioxygenase [Acaryochloridaceae cyanobacterium CSU_3_4]NJR54206.1 Fe2+-dependent dioxygenase [Acaryochloris sp. CRU_2_0]
MILTLDDVLKAEELTAITTVLATAEFVDGKTTAGWHAKLVKNNTQLPNKADCSQDLGERVKTALLRHPLFKAAVQPRLIHTLLFSRYEIGMSYGDHVDNAFMSGAYYRSDVSFTLFLNAPTDYAGGELCVELADGVHTYKLDAGSAIVYPSSTLHRVETVTAGTRLVAVGWIQSLIRDPYKREILFDLDTARRSLFAQSGKTPEFDLISKSYANLLRQWAD